jgi:hypothetical protein
MHERFSLGARCDRFRGVVLLRHSVSWDAPHGNASQPSDLNFPLIRSPRLRGADSRSPSLDGMEAEETHGLGYGRVDDDSNAAVLLSTMDATAAWEATRRLRA